MKKIYLLLITFIIAFTAKAQFIPPPSTPGSPQKITQNRGANGADSGTIFSKIFTDTIQANIAPFIKNTPNINISTAGDINWYRSNDLSHWIQYGTSGGGGGSTGNLKATRIGFGSIVDTLTGGTALTWISTDSLLRLHGQINFDDKGNYNRAGIFQNSDSSNGDAIIMRGNFENWIGTDNKYQVWQYDGSPILRFEIDGSANGTVGINPNASNGWFLPTIRGAEGTFLSAGTNGNSEWNYAALSGDSTAMEAFTPTGPTFWFNTTTKTIWYYDTSTPGWQEMANATQCDGIGNFVHVGQDSIRLTSVVGTAYTVADNNLASSDLLQTGVGSDRNYDGNAGRLFWRNMTEFVTEDNYDHDMLTLSSPDNSGLSYLGSASSDNSQVSALTVSGVGNSVLLKANTLGLRFGLDSAFIESSGVAYGKTSSDTTYKPLAIDPVTGALVRMGNWGAGSTPSWNGTLSVNNTTNQSAIINGGGDLQINGLSSSLKFNSQDDGSGVNVSIAPNPDAWGGNHTFLLKSNPINNVILSTYPLQSSDSTTSARNMVWFDPTDSSFKYSAVPSSGGSVYVRDSITATAPMVFTKATGVISIDSSSMFAKYRDTLTSHNNRINANTASINLKLSISDTAAMFSKYRDTLTSHNNRINTLTAAGSGYWSLASGGTFTGTNTLTMGTNPLIFSTGVTTGTGATAGHQIVANSLTSGNGVDISSTSLTTGNLFKLSSTSTAAGSNTQTVANISTSGANGTSTQTTWGLDVANTHTGTTSTNIGARFTASGGTNNYPLMTSGGFNVINGTTGNAALDIWYSRNTSGGSLALLFGADGISGLTTRTASTNKQGQIGGVSYNINASNNTSVIGYTSSSTANGVYLGGGFGAAAATEIGFYTAAAVNTAGGTQRMLIDASGNVGIGSHSTISARLHPISTTEQLRLGYDASNYVSTTVGSAGGVTYDAVGSGAAFTFNDGVTIAVAKPLTITEGTDGRAGQTTLVAGIKAITVTGLTTSSRAIVTFVSVGGTVTTTWQYKAVCTANTITITAIDNTGATQTLDTSTLNYLILN
jgi:hypothetical protein